MNYRIKINKGKEEVFLQFLRALQSLGVIKDFNRMDKEKGQEEEKENAREVANQYRDLVD
jgi:hypothetical protein